MKLNNKGFTLVEVLAVVVILSILMSITVPTASSLIKRNNEDAYNNLKESIITAAKIYLSDNRYKVVTDKSCDNNNEEILIKSIGSNGLVDSKILIKSLTNSNVLTTTSNGNIINPIDTSKVLDLNNSYIIVKYQCNTNDYTYILEDNYLIWK